MSTLPTVPSHAIGGERQSTRLLRLTFPAGGPSGLMLANRLDAVEGLSRDFNFTVEVLSDNPSIALKDVQGKLATVELVREDGSLRYFNGHVFEFRRVRADGGYVYYEMVLLPWLAYLRLRRDNYLYHNMSVRDQTDDIFGEYAVRKSEMRIGGPDPAMTDACQFDETDYNYVHRRWEAKGWFYWYEHTAGGHTLVLADDSTSAAPIDGRSDMPFQAEAGSEEDDGLREWTPVRNLVPAHVALASFDFKKPKPVRVDLPTTNQQGDVLKKEVYEYSGAYGFRDAGEGDAQTRLRLEEIEASGKHFEGAGNDRYAQPGRSFELTEHYDGADTFLIIEVVHTATNNYQVNRDMGLSHYENRIACIRKKIPWRPGRGFNSTATKVYGLQTAIVTGPPGEEIHTDEYGRVRVQFHWDRIGSYDDKSSAWIRVATAWSGPGFGMTSIPRVGTEVVVQFLNGNPDRPLVTGMVPNQDTMPPWKLPDNKTQSGVLSRSTPKGGPDNANGMRFEDKKGAEQLWMQAERNLDGLVKNDQTYTVRHDETRTVGNDQSLSVGNNQAISVGADRTKFVGKDEINRVRKTLTETVKSHTLQQVGGNKHTLVGKHFKIEAGDSFEITCGKATFFMDKKGNVAITGANINITSSGPLQINGKKVDLNPGGGGAAVKPKPKGGGAIIADVDAQFAPPPPAK
ncbi:type VI secretion system Vgr family protein [Massilia violaceinigra]|nr:type VI secretion system tip protein TssI/VgrG [Massilia violaceinigra]